MIEIRLIPPCRREFMRDVYHPGIISLSRILWGSTGAGLFLAFIVLVSESTGVGVLYAPLAATCFIGATCTYLRVARPKSVIVGHFVATVGGLLGVAAGETLLGGTAMVLPAKLGLAVLLASALMQILDADHPPAAATAAIPAILPLPAPALVLPLHMAWGAILAVAFGVAWNRLWFECPPPEDGCGRSWFNLGMQRADIVGTGACLAASLLMCARPWSIVVYQAGLWVMLAGLAVMSLHHFFGARVLVAEAATCGPLAKPATGGPGPISGSNEKEEKHER
ncbi:MAG: HPP family protein [Desulfovibrionales bacterium]|nr:HPP family protein [Desulfovibrionales bacterium]